MRTDRLSTWTAKDFEEGAFLCSLQSSNEVQGLIWAILLLSRSVESVREAILARTIPQPVDDERST